jgi:hypothetical protein
LSSEDKGCLLRTKKKEGREKGKEGKDIIKEELEVSPKVAILTSKIKTKQKKEKQGIA